MRVCIKIASVEVRLILRAKPVGLQCLVLEVSGINLCLFSFLFSFLLFPHIFLPLSRSLSVSLSLLPPEQQVLFQIETKRFLYLHHKLFREDTGREVSLNSFM